MSPKTVLRFTMEETVPTPMI